MSSWMTANLLTLNSSKTEFLLIGNRQQLTKIQNTSFNTTHSACNLGYRISALSKSCYSHIHQLRCIRPYLALKTASTIATSIVHSKPDYCNSLYFNLPKPQINRHQLIQNSLARVVVKAPKSCDISPVFKSLNWLKINERIDYKLLSLTYKVLTTTQLSYPHNLISLQPPRCTRTSSVVTLARPQASSSLKITNRSFRHASPHLWY